MKRKNKKLREQIDRVEYVFDCIVLELKAAARDPANSFNASGKVNLNAKFKEMVDGRLILVED